MNEQIDTEMAKLEQLENGENKVWVFDMIWCSPYIQVADMLT